MKFGRRQQGQDKMVIIEQKTEMPQPPDEDFSRERVGAFVKSYKERGASDEDVIKFLNTKPRVADFIKTYKERGGDDAGIIHFLTTGKPFTEVSTPTAFVQGARAGLTDLVSTFAGAPVDLVQHGITALTGRKVDPFGGSRSIRRGLENIGIAPDVDEEELPPTQRPAYVAGEVVGGSLPFIAAPYTAPARGVLKPVVETARQAPKRFLAAEASAVTGAAAGGAGAEFVDPGDPVTRLLAELGGGMLSPAALMARYGKKTGDKIKDVVTSFSKTGREQKAAEVLQDIISASGENIDDVVSRLQSADIEGVKLTAGQKTGSPALLAMEKKLAASSSRFEGEAEDLASNSLKQLRELTDTFTQAGEPESLKIAAKLRQRYFDDLLTRRIEDAGQTALEAQAKIGGGTRADLADISVEAANALRAAIKDAREVEKDLWGRIPKETPLAPDGVIARYNSVKSRLLPEESLPMLAEKFIARMQNLGAQGKKTSAGELLTFRSRMLANARDARARGDFGPASQFDELAEGALDDLTKLPGREADNAREFSRALHEKFTNTFAGKALSKASGGGDRIPAEIVMERAFGSGGTQAELRLRELGEAADFPARVFGEPMLSAQERFLKIASQNATDAATGRVNPVKLREFLSKNKTTLDRFPDLKTKLSNAADAEEAFRGVEESARVATKAIRERTAFANLIKTDDPVVAVGNVLSGPNARRGFTQFAKLARRSGEGAVSGLRSSALKNAFDKATDHVGRFSFERFDRILKSGLSKEDVGLIPLMEQNGLMNAGISYRLKRLIRRGVEIEQALANQKKLDKLMEEPDAMFDLVTRIVGANLGSMGAAAQGSSLIAAHAGSRFARNFAEKIPATKTSEVLELAAKDPKFMAMLLRKVKTPAARAQVEKQINAYLYGAGLQFGTEQEETTP